MLLSSLQVLKKSLNLTLGSYSLGLLVLMLGLLPIFVVGAQRVWRKRSRGGPSRFQFGD